MAMGWFSRKRSHGTPASEVAESLYRVVVEEGESGKFIQPEEYNIPINLRTLFSAKTRLYREALVLLVLLSKFQEDKNCEPILRAYEALLMPRRPTPDAMTKLEALKGAMRNLGVLVNPSEKQPLTWSRSWMAGIGYEEIDVINFTLFALHWMDSYIAVRKSVDELCARV
jgi:hypothetical protein